MEKIKITLEKSLIGQKPKKKKTAASLGLFKIGDSIIHEAGSVADGKITILSHLVKVEKAEQ
ncbi:MAG: 50S ribosomal protein L30 [Eubacteriales bacterium]|nr:50S ribosomal protein L30 [Eubacteriales bacterium]